MPRLPNKHHTNSPNYQEPNKVNYQVSNVSNVSNVGNSHQQFGFHVPHNPHPAINSASSTSTPPSHLRHNSLSNSNNSNITSSGRNLAVGVHPSYPNSLPHRSVRDNSRHLLVGYKAAGNSNVAIHHHHHHLTPSNHTNSFHPSQQQQQKQQQQQQQQQLQQTSPKQPNWTVPNPLSGTSLESFSPSPSSQRYASNFSSNGHNVKTSPYHSSSKSTAAAQSPYHPSYVSCAPSPAAPRHVNYNHMPQQPSQQKKPQHAIGHPKVPQASSINMSLLNNNSKFPPFSSNKTSNASNLVKTQVYNHPQRNKFSSVLHPQMNLSSSQVKTNDVQYVSTYNDDASLQNNAKSNQNLIRSSHPPVNAKDPLVAHPSNATTKKAKSNSFQTTPMHSGQVMNFPTPSSAMSAPPSGSSSKRQLQIPPSARASLAKVILHYLQTNILDEKLMQSAIQQTGLSHAAIVNAVRVASRNRTPQIHSQLLSTVQQSGQTPTNPTNTLNMKQSKTPNDKNTIPFSQASNHDPKVASDSNIIANQKAAQINKRIVANHALSSQVIPKPFNPTKQKNQRQDHGHKKLSEAMKIFQHITWGVISSNYNNTTKSSTHCIGVISDSKTKTTSKLRLDTNYQIPSHQIQMAKKIQASFLRKEENHQLQKRTNSLALHDPADYKRLKLQPRKEFKLLEKNIRKQRNLVCDHLVRKHKEFHKSLMIHSADFFKKHKQRKSECFKRARDVRNHLVLKEKKQNKQVEQAEKARLAALRANDMKSYAKLLEEARNDRLKFLMDKTEECMEQISGLLLNSKTEQNDNDPDAFAEEDSTEATHSESQVPKSSSYYASAHVKSEEVQQPSILVGGTLKDYQIAGLHWLVSLYNNKLNGILADEMGLGKTIQTIALLSYLIEKKQNRGPYLVIVPLSTLSNWVSEFSRWCPSISVVVYKGTVNQRKEIYNCNVRGGRFHVLLTTYEYIIRDKARLRKTVWQYAIVDEGHRMKNANSKFAIILGTKYTTRYRVLLTGTPLQNSLPELWALLNFLLPTIFQSVETFDQWFNKPFAQFGGNNSQTADASENGEDNGVLSNEERMLIIHRLHEVLRPFMLRRVKSEVLDQLPDKMEKVLRCELSSWQKALYKQISVKVTEEKNSTVVRRGINNIVMQLRKVCNHPYLFSPEGYYVNEDIIRTSGKVELLDRMLPKLKAAGHRVLMFFQMTAVMSIMEDYLMFRKYKFVRLDGSTPADERSKRMEAFNAPDSPYFLFLLSTRAGGLGLNLATADTVIIFDSDWNPMMDLQAQDRAHRIGQKKTVSVFRLITNSPVEEKILNRATEKLNMSELVVEAGKFDRSSLEEDKSEERLKMMELLLTDFDSSNNNGNVHTTSSLPSSDDEGEQETDDSDDIGEVDLNEQLSRNDEDFKIYCDFDKRIKARDQIGGVSPGLYFDPDELPLWIRHPDKKKGTESKIENDPEPEYKSNATLSKRRAVNRKVSYADGLTDHQFCRLMEQQADALESVTKESVKSSSSDRKLASRKKRSTQNVVETSDNHNVEVNVTGSGDEPSDSSFTEQSSSTKLRRKSKKQSKCASQSEQCKTFLAICNAIKNLKETGSKRQICELFLEKPCPETYADYYDFIENPVAISDIESKCHDKSYLNAKEFIDDWNLMFSNARLYNEEGSWVHEDADSLETHLKKTLKKHGVAVASMNTAMKATNTEQLDSAEDKYTYTMTCSGRKRKSTVSTGNTRRRNRPRRHR